VINTIPLHAFDAGFTRIGETELKQLAVFGGGCALEQRQYSSLEKALLLLELAKILIELLAVLSS